VKFGKKCSEEKEIRRALRLFSSAVDMQHCEGKECIGERGAVWYGIYQTGDEEEKGEEQVAGLRLMKDDDRAMRAGGRSL